MPADFYQQMDQAGILVNAGFQCCDALAIARQRADQSRPTTRSCRTRRRRSRRTSATTPACSASSGATTRRWQAGVGHAGRVRPAGLRPAGDLLGRVQHQPAARGIGGEGRPVRLGAAELLVRHHALRQRRLHQTNAGGSWGLRQRAERRRHHPDDGLTEPLHVAERPVQLVAEPGRQPVPPELRELLQPELHLRHRLQVRRGDERQVRQAGPASPSTSRKPRPRTTRTSAPSSRRSSTTRITPRCRPPGPSTGR